MKNLTLITLIFLISFSSYAFKFYPMSLSLEPETNTQELVYVENDGQEKIALELSIAKRIVDEQGVEQQPLDEETFIIHPSQIILAPQEKRSVRLSLIKKDISKTEVPYRIIVEQLPIDIVKKELKKGAQIKVLFRYVGALYVTPKNAEAKLNASTLADKKDEKKLILKIVNEGTKHQLLNLKEILLKQKDSEFRLFSKALDGITGENILAGTTRLFTITWPSNLKKGEEIVATLVFNS